MASSRSTTRRVLYGLGGLLAVALLVGGVAWGMGWIGGGPEGLEIETSRAESRTITQVVTAFGRAQPEVEVTISPDVSGEIIGLPVKEGDAVQKGDLLARLDPENYRAQVERAQAQVSQARATLAERQADSLQARLDYDRQKKLYRSEAISQSEFQQAKTAYQQAVARLEAARYQVESARASLRDAREQLSKTRIYAPMTGTVSKLNVEAGERVVGTNQMEGTTMMKVAKLDQMELKVDVNENDVVNVALQDSASVEVDAYPERRFRGQVTEIANSARIENQGSQEQVTNFPVKVRVLADRRPAGAGSATDEDGGVERPEIPGRSQQGLVLRPGMSGTVDIYTETVDDVVAVPIQAVTVRDFTDVKPAADSASGTDASRSSARPKEDLRKVVFVAEGDSARMVEVTTGISDDTHIAVRSGLSGDETVITGPYSAVSRELEPGTKIQRPSDDESGGVFALVE
jgi:HlyD family secretion protein